MVAFALFKHVVVTMCVVLASSNIPSTSETESLHVSGDWILEEVAGIGSPPGPWSPHMGFKTSIAIDSTGMPHIAYQNIETMATNYSYKDPTGKWWTETVVEADVRGHSPVLALTSDDRPILCYGNTTLRGVSCAFKENSSWRHVTVEVLPVGAGSEISLALDSLDRPHLAYFAVAGDTKYSWLNGTSWDTSLLRDRTVAVTASISLDLDRNDRPHIALVGSGGGFIEEGQWLYVQNGTGWDKEAIDPANSRGIYSIELNETDSPHLGTAHPTWYVPIYMYKDGGSWRTGYPDLGAFARHGSFSLDSNGEPNFVFEEGNKDDLKYAHREDGTWRNVTVDSEGRVGFLPSLAMDPDNIPHISYIDYTDSLLMYATKGKGIKAKIDIDPDTLNLRSKGKWVTCYIELSGGYDPRDINASTILLDETLRPELDPRYGFVKSEDSYIMDHDGNGIYERMVKFDRQGLIEMLGQEGWVELTVVGYMNDGTQFEGSDTIKVIDRPSPGLTVFSAVDGLPLFSSGQHSTLDGTSRLVLRQFHPGLDVSAEFAGIGNGIRS